MALEAILLGVDGVVAEMHEARRETFNEVFLEAGFGWHWDRACYARLLKSSREHDLIAGTMIRAFLRDRVEWRRNDGDLSSLICAMERRHATLLRDRFVARRVQLRAGIVAFLREAAREDIGLAIVTRGDGDNTRTLLGTRLPIGLASAISVIDAGTHECSNGRNAYTQALAALDVDGRNCLVIENSAHQLAEAREAGLASIVTWGYYPRLDEVTSLMIGAAPSSIPDACSLFLSRWDCASPAALLSYLRDAHGMQCRHRYRASHFTPPSVTLDSEVANVGVRYLEA